MALPILLVAAPASASEIFRYEADATISNVDPAVNGWHGVVFVLYTDSAGTPQVAIFVDGRPVTDVPPADVPALPAIPPGIPGLPAVPGALPALPSPGPAPSLPPAPALPGAPLLP